MEVYSAQVTLSDADKRVITLVGVLQSQTLQTSGHGKTTVAKAMWDTGCMGCCISRDLAYFLGLRQIGETGLTSVHASGVTKVYAIDIQLPGGPMIKDILAAEIDSPKDFDLIIGFDIIRRGNFHLDNINGNTVFTFSLPFQSEGIH